MSTADELFREERRQAVAMLASDIELRQKSIDWMIHADKHKYSYNFSWLGRPIIKLPADVLVLQEVMWKTKPDLVIETGIAHGGSLIFSAAMLELIGGAGHVLGIDIDIRSHNRKEILEHPLSHRISMIQGSSVSADIVNQVADIANNFKTVMVILDSLHTHDHVLNELRLYSKFVSVGSYIILPDTFIEFFPRGYYADRPWDVGNNPYTAMKQFLQEANEFKVDREVSDKALISEAIDGYLKRLA